MRNVKRFLIIGVAFLAMLSCQPFGPKVLPTVTPLPPTATPRAGEVPTPQPISQPPTQQIRQNLLRATVQIIAIQDDEPIWSGSGTIISPDGLILTNAHVVSDPDPDYRPDAIAVALTVRSDQPPELTYLAEVKAIDPKLDLAVIQIVTDLNGQRVDTSRLSLTSVPLGDSDLLELGDVLDILGYPGIGGETITFTEGVVSGFTRERGVEGRAYIKTDATIAGGNSGGLAANQQGEIIGVPTQVGYGGAERFADCRYLADTNGDGIIDENDNCIPVGGFINALRPINLAKPLIEMARLGIAPKKPQEPTTPSGEARFSNLVFSPDVTENDQPTQIVTQLPSGATSLYAFWDYDGMADGMTWSARWYRDGSLLRDVSWVDDVWQGGERGNWWVGITNESGLSDGEYRIELYAGDEMLLEGMIPVGGAVSGPTITNLIFSDGVTADDRPTNPTYLLPSGIRRVYAFFDYDGMEDGWVWSRTWTYEGEEIASGSETWEGGASGSWWVGIEADEPLDPGAYRLEIFVEGALAAAANFTVAGAEGQQAFGPITFAAGVDARGNPVNPATSFPAGLKELHFFCDYTGMQDGLNLDEKWLLDGEELVTFNVVWEWGESGTYHDYIYRSTGAPLPDGAYTLELYLEGQLVQRGSATIGAGAGRPTPTPPPTEGLYIVGTIRDADTGRGIPGAIFIVLKPGIRANAWDGNEDDIYTWAEADRNGYFELPLPLERNKAYSMIAWAEGYTATTGDDILISDEPSPYELEITLQRK